MNSADYGLGAYGGRQWGGTRLSLGATYTRHDVSSSRSVAFPGFTDDLTASYAAGTTQAFGKLSHDFDLGAMSLIPYASLGYVRQDTDAFVESGGPAALSSAASTVDATFTTLGVGADRKFVVGDGMLLTAKGAIGWRHAFAGTPSVTRTLAGGTSFSVVGTPIVAAAGGVVIGAEFHPQYGNLLEIDHGNDIVTRYAHASRLLKKVGDIVRRGDHVADIGSTGRSTGPHLHFEVLVKGVPQDPHKFLSAGATQAKIAALSKPGKNVSAED